MFHTFYQSVVASSLFYAGVSWGTEAKAKEVKRLYKLINNAGSVRGTVLDPLEVVVERRIMSELQTIMDNTSHPLHDTLTGMRSTFWRRLIPPRCNKKSYRREVSCCVPVM